MLIEGVTAHGNWGRGIVIWNGLKSNITITNNDVRDNNCCGIELQDGTASGVTLTGNTIIGNADSGMSAVGLMAGAGPNVIANNTLEDNGRFGIEIKNPDGTGTESGDGSIVVENNAVSLAASTGMNIRDHAGIAVHRRGVLAGNVDVPTGVVVRSNTVAGYTQQNPSATTSEGFGIVIEGTNHTVTGNTLNDNDVGIQEQGGLHPNANYPGDGDQADGQSPEYFGRGNALVACGNLVETNTYTGNAIDFRRRVSADSFGLVTNLDVGKAFCSIQAAIDDAETLDGHTLEVSAGTYIENVHINKSVTLSGEGADVTTVFPAVSNPNPASCGSSSLCGSATAASNIFLVEANSVTIHGFTLDGDNPSLSSSVTCGEVDIDARNGIIENFYAGTFNNLEVYDTIIKNIYLRALYPSSQGGGFHLHNNTVQNVQCDGQSIAIMNYGGSGTIEANTVHSSTAAIVTQYSSGTDILNNTVHTSPGGIHSDNNGVWGGDPDLIRNNRVNCPTDGWGVWVFAPALAVRVEQNETYGCAPGLAAARSNANPAPAVVFNSNLVDGQSVAGATGVYVTTNGFGWGSEDVSALFNGNQIQNNETGFYLVHESGYTMNTILDGNTVDSNATAMVLNGDGTGDTIVKGNAFSTQTTVFSQTSGSLYAYANNITNFTTGVNQTGGVLNAGHNWWGAIDPTGVNDTRAYDYRLGAPVADWGEGTLGSASLTAAGGTGTGIIISHDRGLTNVPFGKGNDPYASAMCSDYYDFFVLDGSGDWTVSVPVDSASACDTTFTNNALYQFALVDGDTMPDATCDGGACWDVPGGVGGNARNLEVTVDAAAILQGTPFVAGSNDAQAPIGADPTSVTLRGLTARSTPLWPWALVGGLAASSLPLWKRRRAQS